jgi:hypothetical protein
MLWKSKAQRENELLVRENNILREEVDARRKELANATLDAQDAKSSYLRIASLAEQKKIELARTLQMIEDANDGIN